MTKTITIMNKHPDRQKCLKMLDEYGTPAHVTGHCKSVAAVACRLSRALNAVGGTKAPELDKVHFKKGRSNDGYTYYVTDPEMTAINGNAERPFDTGLIMAAGLLHDMARVEDRHWDVCADFCKNLNMREEEKIIRIHMQYEFTADAFHLTEADLVCLGDRLTLEDRYAGLDRRMAYIIKKAESHGNHAAKEIILSKKEKTRKLLKQIESRIGMTIDEVMADIDYEN